MKKYITILLPIICLLSFTACGKNDTHEIKFTVPAGSSESFVYSDEEISPTGNQITISSGTGLSDTLVELEPVEVQEENAYDEPTYLTPGMPVKMDVEKGAWFRIGIDAGRNDTDVDRIVSVKVKGVNVRIPDVVRSTFEATILEITDSCCLVAPAEGSQELNSADQIYVPIQNIDSSSEPEIGDIVEITYSGGIMETYPAQIGEVHNIKVIQKADDSADDGLSDDEAAVIENILSGEAERLSSGDSEELATILLSGPWMDGTTDCFYNCKITINGETFLYHSDCGTFNDTVNERNLALDEERKGTVNTILEKYISLISDDVPAE